tara:strand:+ start:79 stop:840 length:762 start_codon:yes stop_codon:yes gene_type:complete
MINSIRNTVLFLLSKDNRGYVSPSEFDYFAKLAQLEIFESYFSNLAKAIAAQNTRKRGLNYADTVSHIENKIDIFTKNTGLTYTDAGLAAPGVTGEEQDFFELPSDLYKLINLTFGGGFGTDTTMSGGKVIQQISSHKFDMIVNSNLTTPSVTYPIFTRQSNKVYVRPLSIAATNAVFANYIRKPVDPHWGYVALNSDPVYNPDSSIDFEISEEDETDLIIKICKYAGLSIREADIVKITTESERDEYTKQNL